MSALVASLSRPADQRATKERSQEPGPGTSTQLPSQTAAPARADGAPKPISFDAAARDRRRLPEGRAATLEIAVEEPGSIDIPDLGLTASADERTPARFEVFATRAGAYTILFRPANGDESRPAGTLVVTAEG